MTNQEIEKMAKFEESYWWHKGKVFLIRELLSQLKSKSGYNPKNCLEVGCGTGHVIDNLSKDMDVYGLDFSEKAIGYCKDRGLKKVRVFDITGDTPVPFDKKFDLILALDVLEHVDDDSKALTLLRNNLAKGGKIIISVPAHKFLWSSHDEALNHKRRYHANELKGKLKDAQLKIELFSYYVVSPFFPILFYRTLMNIFGTGTYPRTSYVMLPSFINEFFFRLLAVEAKLLKWIRHPLGVSLVAVVSKGKQD